MNNRYVKSTDELMRIVLPINSIVENQYKDSINNVSLYNL